MQSVKIAGLLLFLVLSGRSNAQTNETVRDYIATYKDLAIAEMIRTGVPASIKLAQGIYETTAGTSKLVLKSNNHFGIKCKSNWTGATVSHDDDARGECFRKYPSPEDSYRDHSDFLKLNGRYAALFKLDPSDYAGWANGLKNAGYATNPKYPQALIKVIEDYHLQDYTMIALGRNITEGTPDHATPGRDIQIIPVKAPIQQMPANEPVVTPDKPVYPIGEFKINDTKVFYARKGESFLGIARKYEIDLAKLFDFNDLQVTEVTEKDQLIYLQRKRKTGQDEFHIVTPGQSTHDIAQLHGIRLESLLAFNYLKDTQVPAVGEKLYLKSKAPGMPKLAVKTDYTLTPNQNAQRAN